ncbi:hypothetical protein B0I35DRAFT_423771 [Stachybotrys elegans]|uniref:Uncharacterized protein n=1 Tax=Stachybotrys elegans TaxID=80388 RepID=A0A8K0SXD9_9HYPO|nr:hypothetical protein B0I35DRAFT_423771 [Stachybotrys elegans]
MMANMQAPNSPEDVEMANSELVDPRIDDLAKPCLPPVKQTECAAQQTEKSESPLPESQDEIKRLQEELSLAKEQYTNSQDEIKGLQEELSSAKEQYANSQDEIKGLQEELSSAKGQFTKSQVDLRMARKQWKQAAQELNKQRTSAAAFHAVTDDYLKQQIGELRYDIRCLAERYFGNLPLRPWPTPHRQSHDTRQAIIMPNEYGQCPASAELAESFLWRVIGKKIFWKYQWATRYPGRGLLYLQDHLEPPEQVVDEDGVQTPLQLDALRKYHMWRATTAQMIFKADNDKEEQEAWTRVANHLIKQYIDPVATELIPVPKEGQFHSLLHEIIVKALKLDRELSQQLAVVRWVFEDARVDAPADASEDAHQDRDAQSSRDGVRVIVAPGVTKRGKSSGEDFGEVIELMPAEVVVVRNLLSRESRRESGAPHAEHGIGGEGSWSHSSKRGYFGW